MYRRRFLCAVAGSAITTSLPALGAAGTRSSTTTLLVGFAPGGTVDSVARRLAPPLGDALGGTVIIANHTGASGRIALQALMAARADGRILLLTPGANVSLHPHIHDDPDYRPLADLAPIALICSSDMAVIVAEDHPAQDIRALVRWLKDHPDDANCATPGAGSVSHFVLLELARQAKAAVTFVHYRSGLQQLQALLAGTVAVACAVPGIVKQFQDAHRLRILATSGEQRVSGIGAVPTLRESGHDVDASEWAGLFAPAGVARAVAHRIAEAAHASLEGQDMRGWLTSMIMEPGSVTNEAFAEWLKTDYDRWGELVRHSGFRGEA